MLLYLLITNVDLYNNIYPPLNRSHSDFLKHNNTHYNVYPISTLTIFHSGDKNNSKIGPWAPGVSPPRVPRETLWGMLLPSHQKNSYRTTMATHECSGCLQETIQGATEVDATLVLPNSICTAPGSRHTWARKGDYLQPLYFTISRFPYLHFIFNMMKFI